ncbi:unnamed protein product, partial [Amoebophrya sp. A120]
LLKIKYAAYAPRKAVKAVLQKQRDPPWRGLISERTFFRRPLEILYPSSQQQWCAVMAQPADSTADALISFGNLDAVVKNIMGKFAALESVVEKVQVQQKDQGRRLDRECVQERKQLEKRVTAVEQHGQQLTAVSEHRHRDLERL